MNERLLALYREASVPHIAIDPSNNMPYETACFSPDKFAELIVKECVSITLKSGSVPNKSEVAVAEADRIYHKIKEHFGVEG